MKHLINEIKYNAWMAGKSLAYSHTEKDPEYKAKYLKASQEFEALMNVAAEKLLALIPTDIPTNCRNTEK